MGISHKEMNLRMSVMLPVMSIIVVSAPKYTKRCQKKKVYDQNDEVIESLS